MVDRHREDEGKSTSTDYGRGEKTNMTSSVRRLTGIATIGATSSRPPSLHLLHSVDHILCYKSLGTEDDLRFLSQKALHPETLAANESHSTVSTLLMMPHFPFCAHLSQYSPHDKAVQSLDGRCSLCGRCCLHLGLELVAIRMSHWSRQMDQSPKCACASRRC